MPDSYYSHEIEHLFELFSEVCDWFDELGFSYAKTRYGEYRKYLDQLLKMTSGEEFDNDLSLFKKSFGNAYIEINEIIRVKNSVTELDSIEFIEQIKKVTSGHEFRAMANNDESRNFLFELTIASRFIRAGYNVSLSGVCYVVVDLGDNGTLFVECKRVRSENKLGKNVKKANKQILNRIKGLDKEKFIGLVAINITDLLPDMRGLLPDSQEAGTAIHRLAVNNYLSKRIDSIASGMSESCLGVMCESSLMNYFSEKSVVSGFQYSRHTAFIPYSESSLFRELSGRISNQDIVK